MIPNPALLLVLLLSAPADAVAIQQPPTPPADTPPPTRCADCDAAAREAAKLRAERNELDRQLNELQNEHRINEANLNNVRELRRNAADRNDGNAVKQHEQSIDDLQGDNRANREQQFKLRQEIETLNEAMDKVGRQVDACKDQCNTKENDLPSGVRNEPQSQAVDTGTPPVDPPGSAESLLRRPVYVPPLRRPPACGDCKTHLAELEKAHRELEARAERANEFQGAQDLEQFEEQRRKVRDLQRRAEECSKTCVPRTTSFLNPRIIGGAAGGVALVALLSGGGGQAAQATQAPQLQQPQTPQAAPGPVTPAPPQPEEPKIDGDFSCDACSIGADNGFHNAVIRLCEQLTGLFRALTGSISLSHPAPFVSVTGDFNTATGAFSATGRGTVAGFPNVGVRAEGTADARAGRITFDYTMGTGGELPGGQPIVYRITLRKR